MADFEETSGYVRPQRVSKWPIYLTYMMMMVMMMMMMNNSGRDELFKSVPRRALYV